MTTKKPADAPQKQPVGMAQSKRSEHPTLAEAGADKDGKEATSVVANEHEDRRKGAYRLIGGSQSDDWNMGVAEQAVAALWITNSGSDLDRQMNATLAALNGIGPKDELEGMMAAQLIAAHNADGMLPAGHARRADIRGPTREPHPGEQALSDLGDATGGA